MAHVALEQKRRVLVGTLRWRKLVLRAGHERFSSVQRGQLVLFVAACVVVFTVLSGNDNKKANITNMKEDQCVRRKKICLRGGHDDLL